LVRKKKLINIDNDLWHLLGIYSRWKKVDIATALEEILSEKLSPLKNALEGLVNEK